LEKAVPELLDLRAIEELMVRYTGRIGYLALWPQAVDADEGILAAIR
jgi:hypothetical protein